MTDNLIFYHRPPSYEGIGERLMGPMRFKAFEIIDAVAAEYGTTRSVIRSTTRRQPTARARQVAMTLIRQCTKMSLPQIGRLFDRDHTTVLWSVARVEKTASDYELELMDRVAWNVTGGKEFQ